LTVEITSGASAQTPAAPWRRRLAPIGFAVFVAALPLITSADMSAFVVTLGSRMMLFAIAALSLDLILGYAGMVSFGHAAFIGLGAYTAGILDAEGFGDVTIGLPLALGVSALFAAATGYISIRTKGAAFLMITLAFGEMAFYLANSLDEFGGSDGLTLNDRATVAGADLLSSDLTFYYVILACLVLVFLFLQAVVASRFGRVLRGTKEHPMRMAALGYNVERIRLTAYVIAGTICGLAGYLMANQTEFISPELMTWQTSGALMFMVILGGMATLYGPVLGAIAIIGLENVLSGYYEHWPLLLGGIYLLAALFARGGVVKLMFRDARHD
jgi:branched-chain amino acid transport system permease protein